MSVFFLNRGRIIVLPLALGVALTVAAACSGDAGGGEQTPASGESPTGVEDSAVGETPSGGAATAEIKMIPTIQFDKSELAIAAGADVTITADNTDAGVPHNFVVYASRDAAAGGEDALAATEIRAGPFTDTATVNLAAGEYFFRCNVHPNIMMGTLVAR